MEIIAKTFYGFEDILAEEIGHLGGKEIEIGNRAVKFEGDLRLVYESNLHLRTAIAILLPVKSFDFRDQGEYERKIRTIEFSSYMHVGNSFAVRGAVHSRIFQHSQFPNLLLKDAIADYFYDKVGRRPSVNPNEPQILFDVHISEVLCTISINTSGPSLFQRGYRVEGGPAPINEAIAAGLIMMSAWDKKSNFVDIFCGSGTIVIEAALMAHDIPPNIVRKYFSFQFAPGFDRQLWEDIINKANKRPKRDLPFRIIGSDTSGDMIKIARDNARSLPLGKSVTFEIKDFRDQTPPQGGGILISHPPYGKRFDEGDQDGFFADVGTFFKKHMNGWNCWLFSPHTEALKGVGLKHENNIMIYNGPQECQFRKYPIFEGSLKANKSGKK